MLLAVQHPAESTNQGHHTSLCRASSLHPLCSLSSYSSGFQWFYDSFRNMSSLAIQIISCKYRTNFSIYEHLSQKTSCLLSRVPTSVRRAVSLNSPRTIKGSRFAAGALKPILYAHILFRTLLRQGGAGGCEKDLFSYLSRYIRE
jgi:hypothetical protein